MHSPASLDRCHETNLPYECGEHGSGQCREEELTDAAGRPVRRAPSRSSLSGKFRDVVTDKVLHPLDDLRHEMGSRASKRWADLLGSFNRKKPPPGNPSTSIMDGPDPSFPWWLRHDHTYPWSNPLATRTLAFDNMWNDMWDSWGALQDQLSDEMEHMVSTLKPISLDVKEEGGEYIIKADLPGFEKDNVDIRIDDDVLHISVKKEEAKSEKDAEKVCKDKPCQPAQWHRVERTSEYSSRSLQLPSDADLENIKATMEKGVLTINMKHLEVPRIDSRRAITIE